MPQKSQSYGVWLRTGRFTLLEVTSYELKNITFAYLGALALSQSGCPFAPTQWKPKAIGTSPPTHTPAEFREAANGRKCPLCNNDSIADPFHIINECKDPVVSQARRELHFNATNYLPVLSKHTPGTDCTPLTWL